MSRYDRVDPGTDVNYCEGLEPEPIADYQCNWCGGWAWIGEDAYWPYCCKTCADAAMLDSEEN